ncbi:hypothetical protein SELMODRAFT_78511 [Selaginella moellendorffii]|uniref:RBR-type E3 ubiquitin transferase n=2 Tax=Selaginella moellendorffii TaxID=88036 RepID=D8QVL7_SELML|nr:hypothetical protein SELMODRAFT_78511 [Selaginella moellendorffii]
MLPVPAADVTEVCTICAENRFSSEMVTVSGCDHRFCVHCVERHAAVKVTQGEVNIRCPAVNCAVSFSDEECGRLLSEKTLEMLAKRVKDLSIPAEYKVYCPYKDCSEMMDRRELEVSESTSSFSSASAPARACVTCSRCENKMCLRCNVAWHVDMSCDTFQALPAHLRDVEGALLHTLAKRKQWAQCERCGRIIERDGGCEHIKCKCDYEFCYMCGKKWIRANHSCVRAFN